MLELREGLYERFLPQSLVVCRAWPGGTTGYNLRGAHGSWGAALVGARGHHLQQCSEIVRDVHGRQRRQWRRWREGQAVPRVAPAAVAIWRGAAAVRTAVVCGVSL